MGLFSKKNENNKKSETNKVPAPTWSYSNGNRALKILTLDDIKNGEITFPKQLIKFFDLNGSKINDDQEVNIKFLKGDYIFIVKLIEQTKGYMKFEEDFRQTLFGVYYSINRDNGGGSVYIDFVKVCKGNYQIKVGVAKNTKSI